MTAVGLGAPPPATRLSAQADLSKNGTPPPIEQMDDENDITATAPAPKLSAPKLPIAPPGDVAIRTIEDHDEADETEVRTIPGNIPQLGAPSGPEAKTPITPAAGAPPPPPPMTAKAPSPPRAPPPSAPISADAETTRNPADEPDDSVTTQAPAPNISPDTPPIDDPNVIKISQKSLMPPVPSAVPSTTPIDKAEPPTRPGVATASEAAAAADGEYFDDDEDSVTTKGPSVVQGTYSLSNAGADYIDDSVTTQAPITRGPGIGDLPPPIEDGTEGTTQKLRKTKTAATKESPAMPLPADEEGESITAQAPPPLSNMLRVIAGTAPVEEEDDDPYNKTAVMANAPAKPPQTPRNGPRTAAAPRLEPSSESGLRVAGESAAGTGERASLGRLVAEPRPSGIAKRDHHPHDQAAFAKTEMAFPPIPAPPPSLHEVDFSRGGPSRPRYGLLVGIVAAFSVGIPLVLFLALNQSGSDAAPRVAAQPSPDPVVRNDAARARWRRGQPKPPPDPTTSAAPAPTTAPTTSSSGKKR